MIQKWNCPGCEKAMEADSVFKVEDIDLDELLCDDCMSNAEDIERSLDDDSVFTMGVHRRLVDEDDAGIPEECEWVFTSVGEKLFQEKLEEAFPLFTKDREEAFGTVCGMMYE